MIFKVMAELPAPSLCAKYQEMYFFDNAIVSYYNFTEDEKEHTCIRLNDGNIIITEHPIAGDLNTALERNGEKIKWLDAYYGG